MSTIHAALIHRDWTQMRRTVGGEPSKKPNAPGLSLWLKAAKQRLLGKNMNREMSEVFIFTSSNNGFQQAKQNVQLGHQHASNWIGLRHRRFYLGTGEDNGNP